MKKDFFSKLLEKPTPKPARLAESGVNSDPVEGVESFNQCGENCETHNSALFEEENDDLQI